MRYLLITFFRKPNGQIDEQVVVAKRVKESDTNTCNLIMDFQTKKLDKAVVEGRLLNKDWKTIYDYYKRIYPTLIDQLDKNNSKATVKK
jgi:hypothetical protein